MRQFVTFRADDYLLGIDILMVREINRVLDITPVQHARDYVRGLINLRGQTITVFDIGVRLGLPHRRITSNSHNIILKHEEVGLLVDSIGDVVAVSADAIEQPPANVAGIESRFIEGVARLTSELLVILSGNRLLEYDSHNA